MKKLSLLLLLAACGSPSAKAPVADDFGDLADAKSDSFSKKLKLLGTLGYGQSATTSYTKSPIYRGWQFTAQEGDRLHVTASSSVGDPILWLLDSQFNVMAMNDDSARDNSDSDFSFTVAAGDYYLVTRDYNYASHKITVGVDSSGPFVPPPPPPGPIVKKPPAPTCVAPTQPQLQSCSVQWYDWLAKTWGLEGAQLGSWQLPKGVKSEYNRISSQVEGYALPTVRNFDVAENMVYAVTLSWPPYVWGWLYDANGALLAGGTSTTGGPQLTWHSPLPSAANPDACHCSATTSSPCDFCAP